MTIFSRPTQRLILSITRSRTVFGYLSAPPRVKNCMQKEMKKKNLKMLKLCRAADAGLSP